MITLPTLATTANADSGVDLTASGEASAASGQLPETFLTLLGNRLLTLAKQPGEANPSAVLTEKGTGANPPAVLTEKGTGAKPPVAALSQLLARPGPPATLNALSTPESDRERVKSADDKEKLKRDTADSSDNQALQALFAMLPQTPLAQQAAKSSEQTRLSGASVPDAGPLHAGSAQATLAGLNLAQPSAATTTDDVSQKGDPTRSGIHGTAAALTANAQGSTEKSDLSAFQPVLSTAPQEEPRDNQTPSSTPQHALHALSAAVSSATAVTAPTPSATGIAPPTAQINAPPGSPEWQQAIGQQVLMFTRHGQQNAELRLHPEDLGSIQISLKLDNDQAQLTMIAGHSQVRAALEAAMPHLRSALAESGIHLSQSTVSSDAFPQSQSFGGQQESRRDAPQGHFSLTGDKDSDITPLAVPAALQRRAAGNNSVDTFA